MTLLGHENDVKQDRQAALRFLDTISSNLDGGEHAHVRSCVETKILRRVLLNHRVVHALLDFHTGEKKRRGLGRTVQGGHRECKEGLRRVRRRRTRLGRENQEEEERARAPREKTLIITERAAGLHGRVREAGGEFQKQYSVYLERFRNLDYLQAELQTYHAADKAEVDEHDRNLKRMQKRLREEELRILRGEQEPVGSEASKKMMDDQPRPTQARPSQRSQRPRDLTRARTSIVTRSRGTRTPIRFLGGVVGRGLGHRRARRRRFRGFAVGRRRVVAGLLGVGLGRLWGG